MMKDFIGMDPPAAVPYVRPEPPPQPKPENTNSEERMSVKYPHYFKDVAHLTDIDVYRVLDLWQVTDPAIAHAIKKLLAAGGRGAKDVAQDIKEARDSLTRWQAMRKEDDNKSSTNRGT